MIKEIWFLARWIFCYGNSKKKCNIANAKIRLQNEIFRIFYVAIIRFHFWKKENQAA
jgi:hypothetical protein